MKRAAAACEAPREKRCTLAAETTAQGHPRGVAAKGALLLIALYKAMVSPLLPRACRFEPTCSEYAREAITRYGLARGVRLAAGRLLRCRPGRHGGWDPVP
jgi:putative membrane protein insertion efficiency factor